MPSLVHELVENSSVLNDFATRMQNAILDFCKSRHSSRPLYAIKFRIKSYASVEEKLQRISSDKQQPSGRRSACDRLLDSNNSDVTLKDIFSVIEDVIGIRIVFLFQVDKRAFFDSLREQETNESWFAILMKPDGKPNMNEYVPIDEWFDTREETASAKQVKKSGYTSSHAVIGFSEKDGRTKLFRHFKCELQVRTVIEESWGELTHFLTYKKSDRGGISEQLRNVKKSLDAVEESLTSTHARALSISRAGLWMPWIQLWKHYDIKFPSELAGEAYDILVDARNKYKHFDISGMISVLKNGKKRLADRRFLASIPASCKNWFRTQLDYDIALGLLYLGQREDVKEAGVLLGEIIKEYPDHALALLRLGYVKERQKKYDEACCHVLDSITKLRASEGVLTDRQSNGLLADIMCCYGSLLFRIAESQLEKHFEDSIENSSKKKDSRRTKRNIPKGILEKIDEAIAVTAQALQGVQDDDIICSRVNNNIAYFMTQKLDYRNASLYINKLDGRETHNPLILDTIAWYMYKSGGDTSRAAKMLDTALDILREREAIGPFVQKKLKIIESHKKIIDTAIARRQEYVLGEEYIDD